MRTVLFAALAMAGCGAAPSPGGLPACSGDDVGLILTCGSKASTEVDADGREIVLCRIGSTAGRECLLDGDGFRFHCMPETFCRSICPDGNAACE